MERADALALWMAFCVGVSYAAGWAAAIAGSASERYSSGFRVWMWGAGLAAVAAAVAAGAAAWF